MSTKENAQIVRKWLKAQKFRYTEKSHPDGVVSFLMSMASDSALYDGYDATLVCRDCDVQSLFHLPMRLAEKTKVQVLEYFTWVNHRFRLGKFTVDLNDGEIRWETLKGAAEMKAAAGEAMDDLLGFPGFVLDKFLPGLAAVVLGMKDAATAFKDCDRDEADPPRPDPSAPPEGGVGGVEKKPKKRGGTRRSGEPKPEQGAEPPAAGGGASGSASKLPNQNPLFSAYSLEGLNLTTPVPLKDIVAAVKKFRDGSGRPDVDAPRLNVLLSGAPGSGKTAFAKYLAREVGASLRTLKASDLISRYCGETEKQIAEAFSEAKANGEILFLDEIDSFLQDRSRADKSWEVSQVNELLQQMEEFEGVMIGATNFADSLDRAVLRRFTYKLKLDYLTNEGKAVFFRRYFKTPLTDEERGRLNGIDHLTPGDFRTVRESLYYLSGRQTNAARLNALEAESKAKGLVHAKVGF